MIDKLYGGQATGTSKILEQQIQRADLSHLDTAGTLQPMIGFLQTKDSQRATGTGIHSQDLMRLAPLGQQRSTAQTLAHLGSVIRKIGDNSNVSPTYQLKLDAFRMKLMEYNGMLRQVGVHLGKGNA